MGKFGVDVGRLEYRRSEPVADEAVAGALRDAFPDSAIALSEAERAAGTVPARYFYSRVDLNGDGWDEVVAYVASSACGSSGCPMLVLAPEGAGYRAIGRFSGINSPVVVGTVRVDGWSPLLVPQVDKSGAPFRVLAYTSGQYMETDDAVARGKGWRTALLGEPIDWSSPGHSLVLTEAGCSEAAPTIGGLALGASGVEVHAAFGSPATTSARERWGSDGFLHEQWAFPNIGATVGMVFEDEGGDGRVEAIDVASPSRLRTGCGVGIGDPWDAADHAAEKPAGDSQIRFEYDRGKVSRMRLDLGDE